MIIKVYLEVELPIHGGGKLHAPMSLELNWSTPEELGEHSMAVAVEQQIDFVYQKTLIILLKRQDMEDKV